MGTGNDAALARSLLLSHMRFHESASRGDVADTLREAAAYGALWAIGASWARGIREITVRVLPDGEDVGAELLAMLVTTVFGVGTAVLVLRVCRGPSPRRDAVARPDATEGTTAPPERLLSRRFPNRAPPPGGTAGRGRN